MTAKYGNGSNSSIGPQARTDYYKKKALVEAAKEMKFSPLASVTAMPKHFGKKIKLDHYMPLLDDRNVNDQGIDATGATIADGNLYGSSKDVGSINGKLPVLGENGGRVNRVGLTRLQLEGEIAKFGFFREYTQESLDFDSDEDLEMHMTQEMVKGANEISEDMIQIDLLNGAGVVMYAGGATQDSEISGETGAVTEVTYKDLVRLGIELTKNRTPKQTNVISGSRMIDTKTVQNGFIMFVAPDMIPTLRAMTDDHGNPAFIDSKHYATSAIKDEIGSVDAFRIVQCNEMMHWESAGAAVTDNAGYRETGGNYDVFPLLVVGAESFTTIGFQTGGKSFKFEIYNKKPGEAIADHRNPFGEEGFMSIKWYYGSMILRPERLAVIKTAVRY